ncbi:hemin-degrading factor [Glaciimonas sp. PAMC28666]|uniref:hemin-degrading factor n=1 Tax=Glaciimonas sp. PAMC28666 TaxID=2807626 RepID=UPI00196610E9|nr:ChuX/HutX family heme-like substrate-binding protein [Glaciimonas sp. PAMC28666]QRX84229.1 hemin-degrading factor [Glaciimonas sp. PAMC28666]
MPASIRSSALIPSQQTQQLLLRTRFLKAKAQQKLRNRDAATAVGVSEGEALAACVGFEAIRLIPDFVKLFEEIPQLGSVMALTRNDSAVHEKEGVYKNMSHNGHVGLALGDEIDLRIFYRQWFFGCAVSEETPRGTQKSLQFFDQHGSAVHKIFMREHSDHEAFDQLITRWRDPDQQPGIIVTPALPPVAETSDAAIDVDGFQQAWSGLTDTHQFFGLLHNFGVSRTQALRLAAPQYVRQVNNDALKNLLNIAAASTLPIMIFVGNNGMIQIHSGPIANVKVMGAWINVLDPAFNLHLLEERIASSWVVTKPTSDGAVTSLELFDGNGQTIAMLFGVRKPGQAELPAWREAAMQLPAMSGAV